MDVLRALIADDDVAICHLLSVLLESFENVTVVGTVHSGLELLKLVQSSTPDVVFLDVQMPDLNGLSTVCHIQKNHPDVVIVLVTAHAEYAATAFNLNVCDYLVKPIDRDRIKQTLDKVRKFRTIASGKTQYRQNPRKLVVRSGHGVTVINTETILFIEKLGRRCIIHTTEGRYETPEQLTLLQERLDPSSFFRCHKSFIINVNSVEKVLPYADRAYEVIFHNYSNYPGKVTMRREKFEAFCRLIES